MRYQAWLCPLTKNRASLTQVFLVRKNSSFLAREQVLKLVPETRREGLAVHSSGVSGTCQRSSVCVPLRFLVLMLARDKKPWSWAQIFRKFLSQGKGKFFASKILARDKESASILGATKAAGKKKFAVSYTFFDPQSQSGNWRKVFPTVFPQIPTNPSKFSTKKVPTVGKRTHSSPYGIEADSTCPHILP